MSNEFSDKPLWIANSSEWHLW